MKLIRNGSSSKKGSSILDILIGLIFFISFSVIVILAYNVLKDVNTNIQGDADLNTIAKDESANITSNFPSYMDNGFLLLIILFWIFIIVSSFFLDTYPAFFVVSFILMIFVFVIGMILANTYGEIAGDAAVSSFADYFPKINFVMNNLLLVLIVVGGSSLLALYANSKGGGL